MFCRIVAGEVSVHLIAVDRDCIAFLDHQPAAPGHTLVVPRHHAEMLWDLDADLAGATMKTARRLAALLRVRLRPDGVTLRQNNGEASGQKVPHVHLHLVPRWHGDGPIGWPHPPQEPLDRDAILHELLDGPGTDGQQWSGKTAS